MSIETLKSLSVAAGHTAMWRDNPSAQPGSSLENPNNAWDRIFDVEKNYSGKAVSEISSLQLAAVWRCVWIISGTLARTPFLPYRRTTSGRTIARDHYLFPVLNLKANPFMTSFRFKRLMQARLCLWGNAYALIMENMRGQVTELWPLRPSNVTPKQKVAKDGTLEGIVYEYVMQNGKVVTFDSRDVLHLRGLETDGLKGLSPIKANQQALGIAVASEEYGARYFGQGVHPGGYVTTPGTLSPTARKNLSETLNDLYGGLHGAHKLAVLEENLQYHEVGIPPGDMQFLQSRQYSDVAIARLFGVQPHKIGALDRATWGNISAENLSFVNDTMSDWFTNWESECTGSLMSLREVTNNVSAIELDFFEQMLLKGDTLTRFQSYSIGRQNTILSPNDCREMEGLNRIEQPWADDYMTPLNMAPAGEAVPDSADPEVIDDDDDVGSGAGEQDDDDAVPVGTVAIPKTPGVTPPAPKKKEAKKHAGNRSEVNGYHR